MDDVEDDMHPQATRPPAGSGVSSRALPIVQIARASPPSAALTVPQQPSSKPGTNKCVDDDEGSTEDEDGDQLNRASSEDDAQGNTTVRDHQGNNSRYNQPSQVSTKLSTKA